MTLPLRLVEGGRSELAQMLRDLREREPTWDDVIDPLLARLSGETADGRTEIGAAVLEVYGAWRALHPQGSERPNRSAQSQIASRLRELRRGRTWPEAVADAVLLIRWMHQSPDTLWAQGVNPGGVQYLGVDNIFRATGFGDRIEKARLWLAAGAPEVDREAAKRSASAQGQAAAGRSAEAEMRAEAVQAWEWVGRLLQTGATSIPEATRTKAPEKAALVEQVVEEVGGWWRIARVSTYEEGALRASFVAAFMAARKATR